MNIKEKHSIEFVCLGLVNKYASIFRIFRDLDYLTRGILLDK